MIKQIRLDGEVEEIETEPEEQGGDEAKMISIFEASQDIGGGLNETQTEYLFPRLAQKYHFQRSFIDGKIHRLHSGKSAEIVYVREGDGDV